MSAILHQALMLTFVNAQIAQSLTWTSSGNGSTVDITESGRLFTVRSGAGDVWHKASITSSKNSGKWYAEVLCVSDSPASTVTAIGIAPSTISTTSATGSVPDNAGNGGRSQYFGSGQKRKDGIYESYGATYQTGDIVSVLWDADARTVTCYKNGVTQGLMYSSIASGDHLVHICKYGQLGSFRLPNTLTYSPPAGFLVWS